MTRGLIAVALAAALLLIDAPRLIRNRFWGELATYILLTAAATITLIIEGQNVEIPSFITWARDLLRPIGEAVVGQSGI